jgi:surface polysaccharide O-acyltransferase-like enzyme
MVAPKLEYHRDSTPSSAPAARQIWPDTYRGIAIIAVVLIHCTGHALSQLSTCGWSWYAMATVNRLLQFAVPAFLLVSGYLNSMSLRRQRPPNSDAGTRESNVRVARRVIPMTRRSTLVLNSAHPMAGSSTRADFPMFDPAALALIVRRLRSIGAPYLAASAIGLLLTSHGHPSTSPLHILKLLLLGKCYYHLYFVVLIAQLYLVLPLVLRWFRRPRSIASVLTVAIPAQLAVYALNRWMVTAGWTAHMHYLQVIPPISSSLAWYMLPVALGLWLVSRRGENGEMSGLSKYRYAIFWSTIASLVIYLPLSVLSMIGPVNTFAFQLADWVFSTSASLLLILLAWRFVDGGRGQWLATLGRQSLTIYLAHPFVIALLDMVAPHFRHSNAWIAAPTYAAAAILGCLLLTYITNRLRPVSR